LPTAQRTARDPLNCQPQVTGSNNNGVSRTKVATILFAAKASTFNWFDPDILTRHGIQWMPFTPAGSNALLPAGWLQESVPLVQAGTKMATNRCVVLTECAH
jgi:hypothetical protein